MNKKKLTTLLFAALVFALPVFAVFNSSDLSQTLRNLRVQLGQEYKKISRFQARMAHDYEDQHKKMVDLIKECNELSLVLYSQSQRYTFDLAYALEKVTEQYNAFNLDRRPYDRIVFNMDLDIDRYARLLEALRRLPPERKEISEEVPDSLRYRNDTLDMHVLLSGTSLNKEIAEEAMKDSLATPFILDERGEIDRDSCIFYASEMLKMCAERKAILVADSTHYREAEIRLKESYDYARQRYKVLQKRIFIDGESSWFKLMKNPKRSWRRAKEDFGDKYDFGLFVTETDSLERSQFQVRGSTVELDAPVSDKVDYTVQAVMMIAQGCAFLILWGIFFLLIWLACRFIKPLQKTLAREQKPFVALLLAILVFLFRSAGGDDTILEEAMSQAATFLWLLGAIVAALLIRLKPKQLIYSIRLYLPTVMVALVVIGCRALFIPNSMMNFLFPPVITLSLIWLLVACLRNGRKAQESDSIISWASLLITAIAAMMALMGYIFVALLILVWWYFQLAAIHTINTIWNLIVRYRDSRMSHRVQKFKEEQTGMAKDQSLMLFRVTWFYDLLRTVIIPLTAVTSIPFCVKLSLDVFDFRDLYDTIYTTPFVHIVATDGTSSLWISFRIVLFGVGLFFVFRYLAQAIRSLYVYARYASFRRKNKRQTVRNNEINISLGVSLITVITWIVYIVVVFSLLKIPTGWMAMIATGLSAGIGLAMKDILNNFIYGIQLMGGRLRVGDWIECDGVRGRVTKISYQSTQIETLDDALISFLNADLFGKNFANLTRNNSYEFLKIVVGVSYGTDVQKVRDILVDAMQVMRTKDAYGRDIVRPDKGIYVVFGDFGDSSVNIAVKQYILVAEHVPYVDKAKEVIYNALNQNGITIPFPQMDVHVSKEE